MATVRAHPTGGSTESRFAPSCPCRYWGAAYFACIHALSLSLHQGSVKFILELPGALQPSKHGGRKAQILHTELSTAPLRPDWGVGRGLMPRGQSAPVWGKKGPKRAYL